MTWATSYLALDIGPIWQEREGPPQVTTPARPEVATPHTAPTVARVATHTATPAPSVTPRKTVTTLHSPSTATSPLEKLAQQVHACQLCGLGQTRQKTVFGQGVATPTWLVIGEGPGYHEDLAGEPFIGRAGQLLDQALHSVHLDRQKNVYVANAVKCRASEAGKDRRPSAQEIAACRPYLVEQISHLAPRLIFALGASAARALLQLPEGTSVAMLRGQDLHYQGIPVIVSYHPAYLLRTPADKKLLWQDLCRARALVDPRAA